MLDRNYNGLIDDGTELFGNFTPQPPSDHANGFLALAVFDEPANGGNGDGWITAADLVFTYLNLWTDVNHNGLSQAQELESLDDSRIVGIELDYRASRRRDRYGNEFRYMSLVKLDPDTPGPRRKLAVDVFLAAVPQP